MVPAFYASIGCGSMKQFFTKSTVEARCWCKVCQRKTMWRIDSGRPGACLVCVERIERDHEMAKLWEEPEEKQLDLFGGKDGA
jgi:hypothetical protein